MRQQPRLEEDEVEKIEKGRKKEGRRKRKVGEKGEGREERVERVCAGGELTYYQILCHLTRTLMGHANQAAMAIQLVPGKHRVSDFLDPLHLCPLPSKRQRGSRAMGNKGGDGGDPPLLPA